MHKVSLLAVASCLAITACGGGSGDSSAPEAKSSITEENAKSVSKVVLQQITGTSSRTQQSSEQPSSATSSGKSTIKAGIVIEQNIKDVDVSFEICNNESGSASASLNDKNNNGQVDLNETVTIDYTNCQVNETTFLNGAQSITITKNIPNDYAATVSTRQFTVTVNGQSITTNGTIKVSAEESNEALTFGADFINFSEIIGNDRLTIHSGYFENIITENSYELTQETVSSSSEYEGKITIKTEPSLIGSIDENQISPPSSGKIRAIADNGSYILIDTDDGDGDTDTFNLTIDDGATTITSSERWSQL